MTVSLTVDINQRPEQMSLLSSRKWIKAWERCLHKMSSTVRVGKSRQLIDSQTGVSTSKKDERV